jgi:hypothetical protein
MWIVTGTGRQQQLRISVKASELVRRILRAFWRK